MSAQPTLGELLLGIEGWRCFGWHSPMTPPPRGARVSEIRALLQRLDEVPELAAALEALRPSLDTVVSVC
ncbi:MAG: hypothetical protein ACREJ5_24940 [Geminicoccaceae bacterium]